MTVLTIRHHLVEFMPAQRRALLFLAGGILLFLIAVFRFLPGIAERRMNSVVLHPPYKASEPAQRLHRTLFIADLHADSLLWNRDLLDHGGYGHVDIPRLIEGNVALQTFSAVTKVPRGRRIEGGTSDGALDLVTLLSIVQLWPPSSWTSLTERALYQSRKLRELAERSDGRLVIVRSRQDLTEYLERRKNDPGVVAGLLGIEGGHALEGKLQNLDLLYGAGFRMIGLAHLFDNEIGGSAHGLLKTGLSDFGKEVVRRMEALRMIVDLAHSSSDLIDDILDVAARPVMVSHTGVRGTCDNERNLSDRQVRRVARTGGIIGIGFWAAAVCRAEAGAVAEAIRYAVDVAGVDHVALGSDYDGAVRVPFDATGLVKITEALMDQGFSEGAIRKIMGENVIRLFREALPEK